jgi:glycosyltransferase involved in cell wall biosynthesis
MIAIVFPQFYGVHGIARYLHSFLSNLPAEHPGYLLITNDEDVSGVQFKGVEIVNLPSRRDRLGLISWGWAARQLIIALHDQGKISGVNFHFPPLIPGLFLPRHIPMVLTAHTTYLGMSGSFTDERHFDSPWGKSSVFIKRLMERKIFSNAKAVITLTEQGHQEVRRYAYSRDVAVIPNGVDLLKFNPEPKKKKDIDILFVGRIEIRKGSRPMVALCKALVALLPSIKIAIVGYGDDDVFVNNELRPLSKNIDLAGRVPFDQVSDYYRRAKVYASTSYYEGLPGTCLEAMAMGLPAVAWDLLFYHGLIVPGVNGSLLKTNDINQMARFLIPLCQDEEKCQEWGLAARQHIQDSYGWARLASEVTALLVKELPGK